MLLGLRNGRAILVLGLLTSGGCKVDPGSTMGFHEHCSDLQEDLTCRANHPARPFCSLCEDEKQGCVPARPALICQPAGSTTGAEEGDESSSGGSSSGTTVALDTTGADSTTGEPPCEQEGELDPECLALDPARPFCVDAACVGCEAAGGDAFCGGQDLGTPACDAATGACVPCGAADHVACDGATPVCGASGECLSCTAHSQCPGRACHLGADDPLQGHCFAEDEVIHVDNEAACPGLGTEDEPMCSLTAAAATIEPGQSRALRISAGTPYAERVAVSGEVTVALVGTGGRPVITGHPAQQAASLLFEDGATAYVHGLDVDGNVLTHGIMCNFGTLRLEDSRVRGNDGWGVFDFDPCELDVRRTVIAGNEDGGLRISGGSITLDNSTVARNGVGASSSGVRLIAAEAHILYSTIAGNDGSGADSIECTGTTGTLRNSIVVGMDPPSIALDCFPLVMSHNALDAANFAGGTNVSVGAYDPIFFEGPAEGDMRLAAPPLTPYGGVALWVEGDPDRDADGSSRPTDGSLGYAGVDEP